MAIELHWMPGWSYKEYITEISTGFNASQARVHILAEGYSFAALVIDEKFLDQFLRLNNKAAIKVLDALQHAPCGFLYFFFFGVHRMQRQHRRWHTLPPYKKHRFRKLCKALGRIELLKVAAVSYREGMGAFGATLLRSVSQLKWMYIVALDDTQGTRDLPEMIKGLRRQRSMETICISTPPYYYRSIVPELLLISKQLEHIKFDGGANPKPVSTIDAQAIMQLLTHDVSREVVMKDLNFTNAETHAYLCNTLSQIKRDSLVMEKWRMKDPAEVANALAQSAIKKLHLTLEESEQLPKPFFIGFGSSLSPASRLEELVCTLGPNSSDITDHNDECLIAVTRGAARCPQLKTLKLDLGNVSACADEALGDYVAKNTCLLELDVTYRASDAIAHDVQAPKLYEAMKSNLTIQHIRLCSTDGDDSDPWDVDFKRELEAIVALNRIGRRYLIDDSTNKAAGMKLLEQVIDDSSCCVFHLRENPLLCCREPCANPIAINK